MEFSHLVLTEISFYSNIIYVSMDVKDIFNSADQFHKYLFEQKPKSSFFVSVYQLFGDFFNPNTSATISLGKKKRSAALSECMHL